MSSKQANQDGDNYMLGRSFGANNRQNVQFYIWTDGAYILHPSIQVNKPDLRVAEIGIGTGIWLTHLSRTLPRSARIDGYDISLTASAPKEWFPSNVTINQLDCLQPFPHHLQGQYDVVHIQLFHVAVQGNDVAAIVQNFMTLLRPGGYISWGEYDYSTWKLVHTDEQYNDDTILDDLMQYSGTLGDSQTSWITDHWPLRLPQTFTSCGLIDVQEDRRALPPEMIAYQLDAALAACEEMSHQVLDKLGGGQGEKMRDMIRHVSNNRKKTGYNLDRLTVIGRKPE